MARRVANGFFIQDQNGDGNPDTSDAVFVYMNTTPFSVNIGDKVRVTATVSEFTPSGATRSYTELTNASAIVTVSAGNHQMVTMGCHFRRPTAPRSEPTKPKPGPAERPAGGDGSAALPTSEPQSSLLVDDCAPGPDLSCSVEAAQQTWLSTAVLISLAVFLLKRPRRPCTPA